MFSELLVKRVFDLRIWIYVMRVLLLGYMIPLFLRQYNGFEFKVRRNAYIYVTLNEIMNQ